MKLKYKAKLDEFEIKDLNDPNLDPAFVAKAKEFEEKITKGTLSDLEIAEIDDDLCKIFDENHDFEEVDSEEVTSLKKQATITEGKREVENNNDLKVLSEITQKYEDYPEVKEYAEKKAAGIKAELTKKQQAENAHKDLLESIENATELSQLKAIAEEYADNKQIVDLATEKAREIKAESEQKQKSDRAKTLLTKPEWNYQQLRELGINPTGDDMVVDGVVLERQYMFKAYNTKGLRK